MSQKQDNLDIGFGQQNLNTKNRMILQGGELNVIRKGAASKSMYYDLIHMPWWKFLLYILIFYVIINFVFALIYYGIGIDQMYGVKASNPWNEFLQLYFFSVQSFTTVGYGGMHPIGNFAAAVAGLEALTGLLTFAIITGLVFAKFAKPKAKIVFSEKLIVAPFKTGKALMVRFANANKHKIIDAEVGMNISYADPTKPEAPRIFKNVALELSKITLFPLNWTIVHVLTEDSPVYAWSQKDFVEKHVEILIFFKAYDETYNQMVHYTHSYLAQEIGWNQKFVPMYESTENGIVLYLNKISETVESVNT